ncbi:unnamed protein product [Adineta steineri]|uniref:Uncharacterized protein n=1 Tax=Adineta steineri TaxID=433720 RepID=A0A814K7K6_9BILA|nr:unnamed protein product [Adineta steineri]CAF1213344.1 unnamed protein product [Adineta steineri]
MTVIGSGIDDMGDFIINGFYSYITNRIAFTKTYRSENTIEPMDANRKIVVQLIWNIQEKRFQGKWYDDRVSDNGKFDLTYDGV